MYERKDSDCCIRGAQKAVFFKNDSRSLDNFIVGLHEFGNPVLPDYPEYPLNGINLKECRTIPSLKNYINRSEMELIEYFNLELQKVMEFGDKDDIREYANRLGRNFVAWSLEDYERQLQRPNYIYVLYNETVYVSDNSGLQQYPMNEYFVKDLIEDRKIPILEVCEKCLVKTRCTKSYIQNTLCKDAYNEIKDYVDQQLKI